MTLPRCCCISLRYWFTSWNIPISVCNSIPSTLALSSASLQQSNTWLYCWSNSVHSSLMLCILLPYMFLSALLSSSNLNTFASSCSPWLRISVTNLSRSSSADCGTLLSPGEPPELRDFSCVLIVCLRLSILCDDVDLVFLVGIALTLPTGRLLRSASSNCGLGLLSDSERCVLVTFENESSGLLCIPLLSLLSMTLLSAASTGAAASNENASELRELIATLLFQAQCTYQSETRYGW